MAAFAIRSYTVPVGRGNSNPNAHTAVGFPAVAAGQSLGPRRARPGHQTLEPRPAGVYHLLTMAKLFEEPGGTPGPAADVVAVAVNANVWGTFDYAWPAGLGEPAVGVRVKVPFGRGDRQTLGFVVETRRPRGERRLKSVREVLDTEPRLTDDLHQLARWISRYYLAPRGMVLAGMIPSSVGQHAPRTETIVHLSADRADWPARLGARQKRVLDELLEARKQGIEPLPLDLLVRHSGCSRDTIRRLRQRELIRTDTRPVLLDTLQGTPADDPFDVNADQQAALETLLPAIDEQQFGVTLLHGVTGSGKTEVYIRAIRRAVDAGRQAILLVPEIALASQTLERLIRRLPRVAVLHSGMTPAQRAFYWQQVADGHASVVVGPRSAVFAPTARLGLIIVDEEHEGGYKQDTAPRYHGRDVAIKRAQVAGVPVVLGSATPSMESYLNALQGKYRLLNLPSRVRGLAMPKLHVVPMRQELEPGRIELIGRTLTEKMAAALDTGRQIILLMNRRGYASYVFCPSCKWIFCCDECTRAMVFHQATQLAMCHYCQQTSSLPEACPACGGKLLLFGLGIQRVEGELARKFPEAVVARMDSDTMTSPLQFRKVLEDFGSGRVDILLGTQMVAKGLDFPNVGLVGVVSADTSLAIPDFRASERTFQLVVQVAGRAGRADRQGQVVVQTLHGEEPAVVHAIEHDYEGFARMELNSRYAMDLPPYSRLVRLIVRHARSETAEQGAQRVAREVAAAMPRGWAKLIGPQPAGVQKIRGLFRQQILMISPHAGRVQQVLADRMDHLARLTPAELVVDVDPLTLV